MDSLEGTRADGRGIRENHAEPIGKAAMSAARRTGAEGWGDDRAPFLLRGVTGSTRATGLAPRYQPKWPITNRPPATYRDSTIASQPKPPNKNKSRKTASLTPAETRVLTLLTTYQTLAGIGSQLGIARPTVKTHVQNIYKKLGATKRAEAVKLAESAGLLPDSAVLMSRKDLGMALSQQRALHDPRERGGQVEIERETGELDHTSVERGPVPR